MKFFLQITANCLCVNIDTNVPVSVTSLDTSENIFESYILGPRVSNGEILKSLAWIMELI